MLFYSSSHSSYSLLLSSLLSDRVLEIRERELEVRDRFFGMKGEKEEKEKINK